MARALVLAAVLVGFVVALGRVDIAAAQTNTSIDYVIGGYPGDTAEVGVYTRPGASCTIRYVTPLGTTSRAQGLTTKRANGEGFVSWSWFIGTNTRPGTGSVTVNCTPGGSARADIEIY